MIKFTAPDDRVVRLNDKLNDKLSVQTLQKV